MSTIITDPNYQVVTSLDVEHLSITQTYPSGSTRNIHLMRDDDLSVKLSHGGEAIGQHTDNLVLVALDVDGDHDEVSVETGVAVDMIEAMKQAVETLQASLDSLRKIGKIHSAPKAATE